jgi:TetR/AcrR family transcriptional regulator
MASDKKQSRGRGRPRQENAPDPDHVARLALNAFAAFGFEGASVRAIAAAANVDSALVLRRYGSKSGLWNATVDRLGERMSVLWTAVDNLRVDPAPLPDRCRRVIRLFVAFCCEVPELGRFFTDEIAKPSERRDYLLERIWRPHVRVLRPFLQEARNAGVLMVDDVELLVFLLVGMVAMPLMMGPIITSDLGIEWQDLESRMSRSIERMVLLPTD